MSKVSGNSLQLGESGTATQNFTIATANDGTVKLARGNAGATTQDILTVDANGKVGLPQGLGAGAALSMVRLNTANGYGSTNTAIRRLLTVVTNQGTDITYADSATLGASFTINVSGVYAIGYTDNFTGVGNLGISLNSTQLTTDIGGITIADRLAHAVCPTSNYSTGCNATVYLPAGSVIRPHGVVTPVTGTGSVLFTITRVA